MATATIQTPYAFPIEEYNLGSLDTTVCVTKHHGATLKTDLSKALVGKAFKQRIDAVDSENCEAGDEDAFFVADLGEVYRQHLRWKLHLNRVKPYYGKNSTSRNEIAV
jgi:ornithine decarboxylase